MKIKQGTDLKNYGFQFDEYSNAWWLNFQKLSKVIVSIRIEANGQVNVALDNYCVGVPSADTFATYNGGEADKGSDLEELANAYRDAYELDDYFEFPNVILQMIREGVIE